ncbi:nitroreductase [Elusimicrobium simillimum]|uniref:nitroreductase family protein n=1 Tax=Elusimicrobium simillimum TaxID=3143438 RepID=UPI003C705019
MQILEPILNRRSIRKYEPKPVEQEKLEAVLEAARLAPSACNSQPWHFVVFNDEEIKNNFCNTVFTGLYKNTMFAAAAPVIIAVISDKGNFTSRVGNMVLRTELYLIDQGLAGENIALQADALGLGTCFIGWFDSKKAAKFLNLPSGKKVELLIALGYPAEKPEPRPRKNTQEIVSYNKYK